MAAKSASAPSDAPVADAHVAELEAAHAKEVKALKSTLEQELPFPIDLQPTEPDNEQGVVESASEEGAFAYHQAVSFAQDGGYQRDTVRSRLVSGIDAALSPDRLGLDAQGLPEWRGFPTFDPSRKLHVAVWID